MTERGAAIDSFYVTELDGGKIVSAELRNRLNAVCTRPFTGWRWRSERTQTSCQKAARLIQMLRLARAGRAEVQRRRVWLSGRMRASQA